MNEGKENRKISQFDSCSISPGHIDYNRSQHQSTLTHSLRPKSHLLYGEDTSAVRPLNLQKRAAAAEFLRWPQGGPTSYGYILQAVGSPWNYSAEL